MIDDATTVIPVITSNVSSAEDVFQGQGRAGCGETIHIRQMKKTLMHECIFAYQNVENWHLKYPLTNNQE